MLTPIITLSLITCVLCDNSELISVVVIYRHGDRTPIQPYHNDPYGNVSYWPVGFGQLTNEGKRQHYRLGQWLRSRYDGFLPGRYSEEDFHLLSTDTDRTLMSAEANLAGLYPPEGGQVWDNDLPWQPIPIHTAPEVEDNLLAMKKACPRYERLLVDLFKSPFFVNISRQNRDLYAYLTKYSGDPVTTLEQLEYLYNTLTIEALYNFTLPPWTSAVFPDRMRPWAQLSFATACYTQTLTRLRRGPLFREIMDHFRKASLDLDHRKLWVYSGHDITIADVLNTMGAFEYHCPPYASTVLFELRRGANHGPYVNIFYKNSTQVQNISLKGCAFDCDLDDFVKILAPIAITPTQWDLECQLGWRDFFRFDNVQFLILSSSLLAFLMLVFCVLTVLNCYKKMEKEGVTVYMQLPNDEVA